MAAIRSIILGHLVCVLVSLVDGASNDGSSGLTLADKQSLLDQHNTARTAANPTATDMKKMKWNDDLAKMAQLWCDQCSFSHGNPTCTNKPYSTTGQNIYATSGNTADVVNAVTSWDNEKSDYTLATRACASGKVCGHYTQVVWAASEEVGCGIKKCTPLASTTWASGIIIVCNYGPAGNYVGQSPYTSGASCSGCASGTSCVSNLCVNSAANYYTIATSPPSSSMSCDGDSNSGGGGSTASLPHLAATSLLLPLLSAIMLAL